jgi:hypothetical protein
MRNSDWQNAQPQQKQQQMSGRNDNSNATAIDEQGDEQNEEVV